VSASKTDISPIMEEGLEAREGDRHDVRYIIGVTENAVLKRMAHRQIVAARRRYRYTDHKQRTSVSHQHAGPPASRDRQNRAHQPQNQETATSW